MSRELYTFFRSSTSYRMRIALAYKGLEHESHFVNLPKMKHREEAYRTLNPQGLVPVLVDEGKVLIQSMAIIEYLDEVYPEPPLMPKAPDERAYVRAVSQMIGCEIHPLNNVRVLKYIQQVLGADDAAKQTWYEHWIREGLSSIETYIADHPMRGRFCHGDAVTMADVCLVPQIFNAARFNCPLDDYPTLMAIHDACMELPAFAETEPSKQPDAF